MSYILNIADQPAYEKKYQGLPGVVSPRFLSRRRRSSLAALAAFALLLGVYVWNHRSLLAALVRR